MCAGAIFDPGGEFGERRRSSVTSVTQDHGGIVATVTDSSSFGQMKLNICELFCLPPSEWIIAVNGFFLFFLIHICHEYCVITYRLIDSLHAEVFYQCLARAPSSTVRLQGKQNKAVLRPTMGFISILLRLRVLALCSSPILGLLGPGVTTFRWERVELERLTWSDWEPGDNSTNHKKVATPEAYLVCFTWNGTIIY